MGTRRVSPVFVDLIWLVFRSIDISRHRKAEAGAAVVFHAVHHSHHARECTALRRYEDTFQVSAKGRGQPERHFIDSFITVRLAIAVYLTAGSLDAQHAIDHAIATTAPFVLFQSIRDLRLHDVVPAVVLCAPITTEVLQIADDGITAIGAFPR